MEVLKARNITKAYGTLEVLQAVDLQVDKGEILSITGASGAGKSTLLHILGTLDQPDSGELIINQEKVSALPANQLAHFRNVEIGFIFQFHNLLPEFTALENISIPAYIRGTSQREASGNARELLSILGIENRAHHKPSELSGGEQQRVAVARALVNRPSIVFADEPSGNLDSKNAEELHELFFQLRKDLGQTFVIVTHNYDLATLADRKVEIADGKIIGSS